MTGHAHFTDLGGRGHVPDQVREMPCGVTGVYEVDRRTGVNQCLVQMVRCSPGSLLDANAGGQGSRLNVG